MTFADRMAATRAATLARHVAQVAEQEALAIDRATVVWEAVDRTRWIVATPTDSGLVFSVRRQGGRQGWFTSS